jgi:hypothetical protein
VQDVEVTVVRKSVKNINLAIYPPDGRVRISAPQHFSDELIRSVVISRLSWIKTRQASLLARPLQKAREMASGERHLFFGRELALVVIERTGGGASVTIEDDKIVLSVQPKTTVSRKYEILSEWYREQLRIRIPVLLKKWQPVIGVEIREWRIRRMKSRWGTCNISDKRIWLNLELARMSPACLEYVLVHELVHLLERFHNKRFWGFMDAFLPGWRNIREELKQQSLA